MDAIKADTLLKIRVATLKDFAERQRVVYHDIKEDPETFGEILNGEGETEIDWAFEELNTLLVLIDTL